LSPRPGHPHFRPQKGTGVGTEWPLDTTWGQ
jgi:hypothetical protein